MKKYLISSLFLLISNGIFAQSEIDMATGLRSSGKIYVVVLVLLTIFGCIAAYLFILDRRLKKLEKDN